MRKFALEHHEFFSTQLAARYLDLDHEQKDQFRKQWRLFSVRTAESNIEPIASSLEMLGESSNPAPIVNHLQQNIRNVLHNACIDFAPLAMTLRPDQIKVLQEKIEDRNKGFDPNRHGGLAKYRKHKQKELLESLDRWLGGANEIQEKLISEMDQAKDADGLWEQSYLKYSREAQDLFLSIIPNSDAQTFEKKCIAIASNPDPSLSERSRKLKSDLAQSRAETLRAIFQTMDSAQREHLKKETKKLAQELREWAQTVMIK